jgi:putative nucleotidyltransferase with HDIG domain
MMVEHPLVSKRIRTLQFFLLAAITIISFAALTLPLSLRPAALPLKVGDVAPRAIQAPSDLEYVSQVRTAEMRDIAEKAVQPVYTNPDPNIARQQIDRLSATLQHISLIRLDNTMTTAQRQSALASLSDITLSGDNIQQILNMSDIRWNAIQQEALRVLEEVMRGPIRTDTLDSVKSNIPSLVSLTLSEQDANLTADLVSAFVIPNSQYSADLTAAAQKAARDSVAPVVQSYKAGETIVASGEIITPSDMEALEQFGLIRTNQTVEAYLGTAAVTLLAAALLGLYFAARQRNAFLSEPRSLLILAYFFLIFVVGARLIIPNRAIVPYAYPLPALGLLLATLFGTETSMVLSFAACLLAAYGLPNTLELMTFYLLATLCGVLTLGSARRFWAFFRSGLAIGGAGTAAILAYRLPSAALDWVGLATLAGAAMLNGIASASLALLLQYLLAQFLGLPTALQLIEISRPDFPLLQLFLRKAPGTYQHSLQVANLAEQAAEKIGADPLLTRVGALFHDIGKAADAPFFIENQAPGNINTHTDITPEEAAEKIIGHVHAGIKLAHKHRLPRRIDDFILEHHGTMLTRYQYNQALEKAGGDTSKVDIEKFRYPGPRPRSRETALLMLADSVEARARAEAPETEDDLRAVVVSVIERAQKEGQLDNTQLTLRDLSLITDSFVATLRGTYHPRIQYPSAEPPSASAPIPTTPLKEK